VAYEYVAGRIGDLSSSQARKTPSGNRATGPATPPWLAASESEIFIAGGKLCGFPRPESHRASEEVTVFRVPEGDGRWRAVGPSDD